MRFLMVSASYPPQVGGLEILCAATAIGLRQRGHEVWVLTAAPDGQSPVEPGVLPRLVRVPIDDYGSLRPRNVAGHWRRRATERANLRAVTELAQCLAADAVVTWQLTGIGYEIPAALSRLGFQPVVLLLDTLPIAIARRTGQGSGWSARLRRLLYGIDLTTLFRSGLITCSESTKAVYIEAGLSASDMSVVYPGLPTSFIAPTPQIGGGRRLFFCGRLVAQKGVHLAIEALGRLHGEGHVDYRLDIAGPLSGAAADEGYVARLRALVGELDLTDAVCFLGARARDELMRLYRSYDAVLFPSTGGEAFGLVVIEAMSQGVPVIAVADGGPREIISHMRDGLLVEADAGAFSAAIRLLSDDPELRRSIGEAAIAKVRRSFAFDTYLDQLEGHAARL